MESKVANPNDNLKRAQLTLEWFMRGDSLCFQPLLDGEVSISPEDCLTTVLAVNTLVGYNAVRATHLSGICRMSLEDSDETTNNQEAEASSEEEDETKPSGLENRSLPVKFDVRYVEPEIKSSLAYRIDDNKDLLCPDVDLFNGGEVNLNINLCESEMWEISSVSVYARLQDSNGVIALLMLKDALNRSLGAFNDVVYELYLDYLPYARQDRVCNKGESLSIKVMTDLINTMEFDKVHVTDPHSDVAPALLNNCYILSCCDVISSFPEILERVGIHFDALVAPDGGAIKKVEEVGRILELPVIYGHKQRDTATGALTGFSYQGDVVGKNLLMVDDCCDGGGTFIGLGEILKEGGASAMSLYTTHGIFSRGLAHLLDMFEAVYTTDSFISGYSHPNLYVKEIYGK